MGRKKQKYAFTRDIEILVAYAEVTSRKFHEAIGYVLDQDRMPSEDAQLLVAASQQINKETGLPCTDEKFAIQHLKLLHEDGKVTYNQLLDVHELLETAKEDTIKDLDAFIVSVIPVIKRIKHKAALEKALKDYSKNSDVDAVSKEFDKIANLGKRKNTQGSFLLGTDADFEMILNSGVKDPLSTSVPEIDLELDGGLERGSLGVIVAGSGDGKSYMLCSIAAEAILQGENVLYITLELGDNQIKSRVYRNILDMSEDEMTDDRDTCIDRMKQYQKVGLGALRVQYETPGATTPGDIRERLKELEQDHDIRCSVVLVDYADKIVHNTRNAKRKYEEMELVYDALRDIGVERGGWVWTASQTTRSANRAKRIDQKDVSDSMHKVRSADLMIAVVRDEEDVEKGLVNFCFPKRRNGPAPGKIGPLTVAWDRGKMTDIVRIHPWDEGYIEHKTDSVQKEIAALNAFNNSK